MYSRRTHVPRVRERGTKHLALHTANERRASLSDVVQNRRQLMGAFACVRLELDTESHYHKSIIIVIGPGSNRSTEAKWKIEFKIHSHRRRRARNLHTASAHLYRAYTYTYMQQPLEPNSELMVHILLYVYRTLCVLKVFEFFCVERKKKWNQKKNQYHCNGCGSLSSQRLHHYRGGGIFGFSFAHSLLPYNTTRYSAF